MGSNRMTRAVAGLLASAALVAAACAVAEDAGFESDVSTIQVVTTLLGGKNVFIPGTWVLSVGEGRVLTMRARPKIRSNAF